MRAFLSTDLTFEQIVRHEFFVNKLPVAMVGNGLAAILDKRIFDRIVSNSSSTFLF